MAINVGFIKSVGQDDSQQGVAVTETWEVVDDTGDEDAACNLGPVSVLLLDDLPKVGDLYDPTYGGELCDVDIDFTTLKVARVILGDPIKDGKLCYREVTIEYASQVGTPVSNILNPLFWFPNIEVESVPRTVPVTQLLFLGGYLRQTSPEFYEPCGTTPPTITLETVVNSAVNRPMNTVQPVASTAGELIFPLQEIETADQNYRISFITEFWDANNIYRCYRGGGINHDDFTVHIATSNFTKTFKKHTILCRDIIGRPGYKEWKEGGTTVSQAYWAVTIDLLHRETGWYLDLPNRGILTNHKADDVAGARPDGMGGTFHYNDDFPIGRSALGAIIDAHDFPLDRPINLNKAGDPIREKDTMYVLRYLKGWEADFENPLLGLPLGP